MRQGVAEWGKFERAKLPKIIKLSLAENEGIKDKLSVKAIAAKIHPGFCPVSVMKLIYIGILISLNRVV